MKQTCHSQNGLRSIFKKDMVREKVWEKEWEKEWG